MPAYLGWVPTITGRAPFHRVGGRFGSDRAVCVGVHEGETWLFGWWRRVSREAPFPPLVMRCLGRIPEVHYLVNLRTGRADGGGPDDPAAVLAGEVIFFSNGAWARSGESAARLRRLRRLVTRASSPHLESARRAELRDQAVELIEQLRERLKAALSSGGSSPAFGLAGVRLFRTGRCEIFVADEGLYTTAAIKAAQRAGPSSEAWRSAVERGEFENPNAAAGRQVFLLMGGLVRQTFEDDPQTDLLAAPSPASLGEARWREEVQHAIARQVVSTRRRGTVLAYRQALGLLAYADAFQKHLCAEAREGARAYDFAALRASVEASLRVREVKDANNRQTALFLFGFVLTGLGLIFAAKRDPAAARLLAGEGARSSAAFDDAVAFVASHPIATFAAGFAIAMVVVVSFLRQSIAHVPLAGLIGGLGRAADAFMASALERALKAGERLPWLGARWLGFGAGVGFLLAVLAVFMGLALLAVRLVVSVAARWP